jgi:arabinofuranosyltransferase
MKFSEGVSDVRSRVRLDPGVCLLLALLLLWGGFLIFRTSFVAQDGRRYFCLFDDAMISMTYARNLVEGYGLNWARHGDPVEGFTHPLWLLPMIAANLLPVELRLRSLPVQLVSLAVLALLVLAVRRLMLSWFSGERARHWMPAAVMTAFCYSLAFWSLIGMETGLQALLAVVAVHLAIASVEGRRERHLELWAVCAAAYLARMDMLLLVLAVQVWVAARGGLRREPRRWLLGLGLFLAVVLGYELFRWVYFHDLLPNTYYLKMTGVPRAVRLLRGLLSLELFVRDHLLLLLAAGIGAIPLLRRDRRLELPAAIFLLYCAYSVWVGGDAWDLDVEVPVRANRFISFVLPLLFVLLNGVLNRVLDARKSAGELPGKWAAGAAAALGLVLVNGLWPGGTDTAWRLMMGTQRPPQTESHLTVLRQLHRMQKVVRPGATVATAWAGIPAYFSDYKLVDILGFNDRHVARAPSRLPGDEDHPRLYRPGHDRWDFGYLFGKARPDAFFQVWGPRLEGIRVGEMMRGAGYVRRGGMWLKRGSVHVPRLPPAERPAGEAARPRRPRNRPAAPATGTSPP